MNRLLVSALALACVAEPALAQSTTVDGVAAFGWMQPYVNAATSAVIMFVLGWLAFILKSKWNIEIDATQRATLHAFLARQAASLVADGFVKVTGLKIDVHSQALANAANMAGAAIPGALAHFNLTPDKLASMIVDKIPAVPSVAAVAGAQSAPPPAAPVVVETAPGSRVSGL